jgi:hypothetical protein
MKTLAQVEPRTLISSLPFFITNSGSYYLAGSLTGASSQSGIIVQADNVTLDLNGFALAGVPGSLAGITVIGGAHNFVTRNGIILGWGGNGLDAGGTINSRVEDVIASGNGGHGLVVGTNGWVGNCQSAGNSGDGIQVAAFSVVMNSACATDGAFGIHATDRGNRIDGNHVTSNVEGIKVDGLANLVIRNTAAFSVVTDFDIPAGNSYGQLIPANAGGFTNANAWANFSGSCSPGLTFCGTACVSLMTDANNCGTCGNVCPGSACFAGVCGGCNVASDCPLQQACDTSTHTCGSACGGANQTVCNGGCCNAGTCASGTQTAACGTSGVACVDCSFSPNGHACQPGNGFCGCNSSSDCPVGHTCNLASHFCQ